MSRKDKWVSRFSVDETAKHKNGFTIYKITSVLFPIASPDAMSEVSVWKRFSDVQRLHKKMRALHSGLHLKGTCPDLPKRRYFARFQKEVIEERCKCIKTLLEFIAEHSFLFTSTDFVNFLQPGHSPPSPASPPQRPAPHCEVGARTADQSLSEASQTINDTTISQIPIFEPQDIEIRPSQSLPHIDSFESMPSIDSSDDLYKDLDKINLDTKLKSNVLPDLINFDVPSTSKFEDYHTHNSETLSISTIDSIDRSRSTKSTLSMYKSTPTLSDIECKTRMEDSYVFEAGYIFNLAARYEGLREYQKAFDCYKVGIEKMLAGVQSDTDPQRRDLIKKKTNKYLAHAEHVYKKHLSDKEFELVRPPTPSSLSPSLSPSPYPSPYPCPPLRVVCVVGALLLVLQRGGARLMKIIKKIPNNLTDEYFLHDTPPTRQPILPRNIPYMVQLHSHMENNDLIFLLLTYAPGVKLFDYIKNYTNSMPNTPSREVNFENVFTEPKTIDEDNNEKEIEENEDEIQVTLGIDEVDCQNISIIDRIEANIENNNKSYKTETTREETLEVGEEVSVNDLVKNSQKLLKNVDKVLSEVRSVVKNTEISDESLTKDVCDDNIIKTPKINCVAMPAIGRLPPGGVCRWGGELLTAIQHLHRAGVVLVDLNPSNILLGDRGQIILTYFTYYPGEDMCLAKLREREAKTDEHTDLYIAPELYMLQFNSGVCDFWSFGVVMYELLCGVPLSYYHRSRFTSHTILQMPDGLPIEQQSLLTQLLTYDPSERLGGGKDGIEEIKRHPYFKHTDWQEILDSWVQPD